MKLTTQELELVLDALDAYCDGEKDNEYGALLAKIIEHLEAIEG